MLMPETFLLLWHILYVYAKY